MPKMKIIIPIFSLLLIAITYNACDSSFNLQVYETKNSSQNTDTSNDTNSDTNVIPSDEQPPQQDDDNITEPIGPVEDVFFDSFESGDLSATSASGFKWGNAVRIGVVNNTHQTYSSALKSSTVTKQSASDFSGDNWQPLFDQHSLRFAYPAGEPWSELRFNMGTPMKDVWIRFWMRVPENFSYGPEGSPNKLIALWSDEYSRSGDGSTVWLGFHRKNTTDATFAITYSNGGYTTSNAYTQDAPFLTTRDQGRWMHLVFHFKTESSPGARNGAIQTFRRWQGESDYEKVHDKSNLPIKVPSDGKTNGFKRGYILGWANAHYKENTEWLIDNFAISATNPIP